MQLVLYVLDLLLAIVQWVVFAWVVLSWVLFFLRESKFRWRNRRLYGFLEQLNDIFERFILPILRPIRRWLRRFDTGRIDWSPMVLLLIIWVLRAILRSIARQPILSQ